MRILPLILLTAVIGSALGSAAALVQFRLDRDKPLPSLADADGQQPSSSEPTPRAEVAESEFNFGAMQRGTKNSHQFVIKNVGNAPLTLKVGQTSCKCTLGVASDKPVVPGESTLVRLDWTANADAGTAFRQTATLLTNDPQQSSLTLTIVGQVNKAEGIEPPDFVFDKVPAGESKSAHIFVMSMFEDQITVTDVDVTHAETRPFFDRRVEPVSREELPNPAAKAGARVTVTVKPGLPLGLIGQRIKLKTSLKDAPELEIPVIGRVVGDISIHGTNWNVEQSLLVLGHVHSREGKRARLNVLVRGATADKVSFKVESCEPPELRVSIGEPNRLKDDLFQVPFDIEVPAGTPPMIHSGTDQGDDGRIVISTTHPTIHQLVLGVRFTVER
ncbi:MAG: DUF1573 domain-containing protein [Pirellulales bacterium]